MSTWICIYRCREEKWRKNSSGKLLLWTQLNGNVEHSNVAFGRDLCKQIKLWESTRLLRKITFWMERWVWLLLESLLPQNSKQKKNSVTKLWKHETPKTIKIINFMWKTLQSPECFCFEHIGKAESVSLENAEHNVIQPKSSLSPSASLSPSFSLSLSLFLSLSREDDILNSTTKVWFCGQNYAAAAIRDRIEVLVIRFGSQYVSNKLQCKATKSHFSDCLTLRLSQLNRETVYLDFVVEPSTQQQHQLDHSNISNCSFDNTFLR